METIDTLTIKGQVEQLLRNLPPTRDSDSQLTLEVWRTFYPFELGRFAYATLHNEYAAALTELRALPSQDNIKRLRADFNAQGKYYPTSWEVAKKRGWKEDEWRKALGYPSKEATLRPTVSGSWMEPQRPPEPEHPQLL